MTNVQFRVLYQQFLFRLMDVELLSLSAQGDSRGLFGQFGAMLITVSAFISWIAISIGMGLRHGPSPALVWGVERWMAALTMLVVGAFALLSWDSMFLDRRDVLVLAPLPVRVRTLFRAKIAAAASALALIVVAVNSLAAFVWPMMIGPVGSGLFATLRFALAFWITLLAAGAFLYCAVLSVQGAAAQLPRRWYLRVSSVLQLAMFVLFLGVFCLQPSWNTAAALSAPENQSALAWLPQYWFMGLLSELSGVFPGEGHAAISGLAFRAVVSLPIVMLLAGGAFLLSYLRTMRKIVEEPDILPGSHGGLWLPRFGSLPQTAVAQFVIRTLMRSRQHRVILMVYLGGGFALVTVYMGIVQKAMQLSGVDTVHRVNVPTLVASFLMLCASVLGTRAVFSLPLDLRANWLFRVLPSQEVPVSLSAVQRAMMALSVLPITALSAAFLFWFWPWTPAAAHVLILWLLGTLLTNIFLLGFRKIPFTCSYLPGKSKVHVIFWAGVIPLIAVIHKIVEWEERAMERPLIYSLVAAALVAAGFTARRLAAGSEHDHELGIAYEDAPTDEVIVLGL